MPQVLDRATFYDYAKRSPFGNRLSPQQVKGVEEILDFWESRHAHRDLRFLAYILATVFHETGSLMVPVREGFAKTDAGARKVVAARKYGIPHPATGHVYYGRGRVQLTWYDNYVRMGDLLNEDLDVHPDLALNGELDVQILFLGMLDGHFTGKKLQNYFSPTADDPVGARRIINGTDKAQLIATYYAAFLESLKAAVREVETPSVIAPAPVAAIVDGPALSTDKTIIGAITAGSGGLIATLVGAINNPWALLAFIVVAAGIYLVVTGRIEIKSKAGA